MSDEASGLHHEATDEPRYRARNSEEPGAGRMTRDEMVDHESVNPLVVTASVIETGGEPPDPFETDDSDFDQKCRLADALLEELAVVTDLTGWERDELGALLGCEHPDPGTWLDVDIALLQQSVSIVQLMREHAELSANRPVSHLVAYLRQRAGVEDETLAAADALLQQIERRSAARESLNLSIEMLSRLHGDVDTARLLLGLSDPGRESTAALLSSDRLGSARAHSLDALRRMERRELSRSIARTFVQSSRDEMVVLYGEGAVAEGEAEAAEPRPTNLRTDWDPDEIRQYVARRTRST